MGTARTDFLILCNFYVVTGKQQITSIDDPSTSGTWLLLEVDTLAKFLLVAYTTALIPFTARYCHPLCSKSRNNSALVAYLLTGE